MEIFNVNKDVFDAIYCLWTGHRNYHDENIIVHPSYGFTIKVEDKEMMTRKEALNKFSKILPQSTLDDLFLSRLEALGLIEFKEETVSIKNIGIKTFDNTFCYSHIDEIKHALKAAGYTVTKNV